MDVWSGYIGLSIAFVIISAIVLWFSIRTPGQIIIKAILIPATVWYGLVLYYTVPNLMGWPISQTIPENSQVLAIRIKEPNPKRNDLGAIYFWVNIKPSSISSEQTLGARLNPKSVFSYNSKTRPRAYQLPYSRKMHKAIVEAQRKAQGVPGAQIRTKKGEPKIGNTGNDESKTTLELEIINPVTLFPK
ncbi:MAG: hypothetical protein JSV31_08870 [Desulfobacterales bacterium]|nr:MAG: hypothetical protein JSV31_08870 [Desulfobacterales bacterium]